VVDVAPATFVNVVPPSVLTVSSPGTTVRQCPLLCLLALISERVVPCHCTVGIGVPDADAVNVAVLPAVTVTELGFVVIDGSTCTVSVADVLVADPAAFMNTA